MSTWILFVLESAVAGSIAAFLIAHEDYEDGVIGRFALGLCLCVPCALVVGEAALSIAWNVDSATAWVPPIVVWVMFGVDVFMGRHAWRWWHFRKNGDNAWRKREPENRGRRSTDRRMSTSP